MRTRESKCIVSSLLIRRAAEVRNLYKASALRRSPVFEREAGIFFKINRVAGQDRHSVSNSNGSNTKIHRPDAYFLLLQFSKDFVRSLGEGKYLSLGVIGQ